MSTQIAIRIPERVYRQAKRLAQLTDRNVNDLITVAITLSLEPVTPSGVSAKPVAELSNKEVFALTALQLPVAQDKRLSRLLFRQQTGKLTGEEGAELISLMRVYREGILRKAQALREAVRRGLIEPLTS